MKVLLYVSILVGATAFAPFVKQSATPKGIFAGYVPDGMTPEQYKKLRSKEKNDISKKNLGAFGPQSFQSRSLLSFQKDLERGNASHLMPMFDAKAKLKSGKIKQSDIPYMQRQGSWDNSDLGGKKRKWTNDDKNYQGTGWKPAGLDWSGNNQRRGPQATKQQEQASPKKSGGFFGLF